MSCPLIVGIAIANAPPDVNTDEILELLAASGGVEIYQPAPPPPGYSRKGNIDAMLILNATGSIASIAALLWMAYDKFIVPKKGHRNEAAGICVIIEKSDGSSEEFWIDESQSSKEIFIGDLTSKVTSIRESKGGERHFQSKQEEIRKSGIWIRRK